MYVFVVTRLCLATLPNDSYFPTGSIIYPPFYGHTDKTRLSCFLLSTDATYY